MELTGKKLEDILNTVWVGRDVGYSHWNFSSAVLKLIRILAKDAGLNEQDFNYKQEGSSNTIYLTYKGTSFGDATFQKQKGKYHYGHCEWTFKKCFVNLWNEDCYSYFKGLTLQEMLDKIVEDKNIAANKEAKKLEQAREIFQMIKDKLGTDDYGTRQFVEFLNKNKYTVSN